MKTTLFRSLLLCLLAIGVSLFTFAQEALTETYTTEDGSLSFRYPEGWRINDLNGQTIMLRGSISAPAAFTFYPPDFVEIFASNANTAEDALDDMADSFGFIVGSALEYPLVPNTAFATVLEDGEVGFVFMTRLSSGRFAMLQAMTRGSDPEETVRLTLEILRTMDSGNPFEIGNGNNTTPSVTSTPVVDEGFPQFLTNHAGEWQDAVEELEEQGVIASGGSLVFNENRAFFSGQGNFFTPLARNSPFADIIMSGELSFNVGNLDELEQCVLTSRIETDNRGNATKFLDVGFLNDGTLFVIDVFSRSEDPVFTFSQESLDLDIPHHILYLAQDDTVTVYLNGELIIENFEIENRSGTYGISLLGRGPSAQCVGNNIWVYQAPAFNPGVCEVSAASTVNKRSGPGTTFDRAGQLGAGVVEMAVAQGNDGDFIWWQLEDDTWVREDVVRAVGDCRNLPDSE